MREERTSKDQPTSPRTSDARLPTPPSEASANRGGANRRARANDAQRLLSPPPLFPCRVSLLLAAFAARRRSRCTTAATSTSTAAARSGSRPRTAAKGPPRAWRAAWEGSWRGCFKPSPRDGGRPRARARARARQSASGSAKCSGARRWPISQCTEDEHEGAGGRRRAIGGGGFAPRVVY